MTGPEIAIVRNIRCTKDFTDKIFYNNKTKKRRINMKKSVVVLFIAAAMWTFISCGSGEKNTAGSTQAGQPVAKAGAAETLVNIPDVQTYSEGIPYRGVNLAGGAFRDDGNGWAASGKALPGLMDAALFIYKGMNIFRIPIAWEYLANIDGSFKDDPAGINYQKRLSEIVTDLTGKKAMIILDLHNYMRYNLKDISLDHQHTDPNGPDVIGSATTEPTKENYAALWKNIVVKFPGTNIIYGIMNEPHHVDMQQLIDCQNSAIKAIREQEKALGINEPHYIFIDGNNWSGLHSWNKKEEFGCNADVYPQGIKDPRNKFVFDVHQYLDKNQSGHSCICIDYNDDDFRGQFDKYWAEFTKWARKHKARLFLGEFGICDNQNCKDDLKYLLDHVGQFPYKPETGGFLGWSVWAAGGHWGGEYILSIAPGGAANSLMWDFYPQYLTERAPFPPLGPRVVSLKNISDNEFAFSGGALPFQHKGPASLQAYDGIAYIYESFVTAGKQVEITYEAGQLGFGIDPNGYGYAWCNIPGFTVSKITPCHPDDGRCWEVKKTD
jgi:endoglucanase